MPEAEPNRVFLSDLGLRDASTNRIWLGVDYLLADLRELYSELRVAGVKASAPLVYTEMTDADTGLTARLHPIIDGDRKAEFQLRIYRDDPRWRFNRINFMIARFENDDRRPLPEASEAMHERVMAEHVRLQTADKTAEPFESFRIYMRLVCADGTCLFDDHPKESA